MTETCASVFAPEPDDGLDAFASSLQELVLWLRDEGHVLSAIDQHFIESWWSAGYPLPVVLEVVRETGLRLKARKSPPRGLPLRSMRRQVERAGDRALRLSVGAGAARPSKQAPAPPSAGPLPALLQDLADALAQRTDASREALASAVAELEALASDETPAEQLFCPLLAVGRRYYQALIEGLPRAEAGALRESCREALGEEAARAMDSFALEETLDELARRQLRALDPIFDPDRYWCFE